MQRTNENIYLSKSYSPSDLDEILLTETQLEVDGVFREFRRGMMPDPLTSQVAGYARVASCAVMQSALGSDSDALSGCMKWEETMRRWRGDVSLFDPRPLAHETLEGLRSLKSNLESDWTHFSYTASMLGRGISQSVQESATNVSQWWDSKSTLQKGGYVVGAIAIGAVAIYFPPLAAAVL